MIGRFASRTHTLTIRLISSGPRVTAGLGGMQSSKSSITFEAPRQAIDSLGRPVTANAFNLICLNPNDDGG